MFVHVFMVCGKSDRGGLHRNNEVNDAQLFQNFVFPFVLFFGMNNVNNVNNALKSSTYNVNDKK